MPSFIRFGVRRTLLAAIAALVLGGTAIGVAAAQQSPPSSPQAQNGGRGAQFLAALAKRLNISTDQLQQAMAGARQDVGLPANQGGPGGNPGGPGGNFRGPGGRGMFLRGEFQAAATALGLTPQQLMQQLPGHSLADVAASNGKTTDVLVTALTDAANQQIATAVSNQRLTADQAATIEQNLSTRIQQAVTRTFPNHPAGVRGGPGSVPLPGAGGQST